MKLTNPISGEIKELSKDEFLALFDPSVHGAILLAAKTVKAEAVVCMENLQMDSSRFGDRVALCVGAECTYQIAHCEQAGFRLGDLPSRFQYPVAIWRIEGEAK